MKRADNQFTSTFFDRQGGKGTMIAADRSEIREWFEKGVAEGYKYMLIVYDRMEYPENSDSPYYCKTAEGAEKAVSGFSGDELSKVMEVYDLSMGMEVQLAEKRAWHLPGRKTEEERAADFHYATAEMMYDGTWPSYEEAEKDPARMKADAAHYWGEAVKLDHTLAALRLGLLYAVGEGVEKNHEKALELFETAANAGHIRAFEMLCLFYWRGLGVQYDLAQAARWAAKAARHTEYCLITAKRLRDNPEQLRDNLFGYVCLTIAAEAGEAWAAPLIDRMFEDGGMPVSREEADRLIQKADMEGGIE